MQRSFFMDRMAGNLKKVMLIAAVLAGLLVCRLFYIQITGNVELAAVTRMQSMIALEGGNTRGIIYDRNGSPLVADEKRFVYIINKKKMDSEALRILDSIGAHEVLNEENEYAVYSSESYEKYAGHRLISGYGAYILQASARYSDEQTAVHLIGYVNRSDSSGAAGLELMYDDQLSGFNRRIYAVADVKGGILPGRGLVITSDSEKDSSVIKGIRTTVDKELQQAVEEIIQNVEKDCAVVILDASDGGVAAMACTPSFDPNDVGTHLESDGDELVNKATQGEYAPGSVFKIAVAAAALENGVDIDCSYDCTGSVSVGDLQVKCETGGDDGHGSIGFEDAFAQSCNSFFIQLGQEIGADDIIETAQKLGLGKKALTGYPQESAGHLMTSGERSGDAIANLSIGQGETLVTPLQVAHMTGIIASGGIDRGVHMLMEEEAGNERVISGKTAGAIAAMMEKTTESGTVSGLDMTARDGSAEAAVKTGTAEYSDGETVRTHGWITGYAPCSEPEYVITVFVEDGGSGSASAGPVFEKILEYMRKSGSYSSPALA